MTYLPRGIRNSTVFAVVFLLLGCGTRQQSDSIEATPAGARHEPPDTSGESARDQSEDALPDDYIPFTLRIGKTGLEGHSEYLEGFEISMDIPQTVIESGLDLRTLMSSIEKGQIHGTLTYPNGRTTPIQYEIVRHRGVDEIYMKTSLGYFLWERVRVGGDRVSFAIYWWYCPPARQADVEILAKAEQLLANRESWHKEDDRECDDDLKNDNWSLFCALKHASIERMGEYNHHNTAMQTVRFVIDELVPGHGFAHTLMDYNNAPSTRHEDIIHCLETAKKRIEKELDQK